MTLAVDLFFSFRSPYSYLALPKTRQLVADYDVAVNLRAVYPLAVRVPGFFKRANPRWMQPYRPIPIATNRSLPTTKRLTRLPAIGGMPTFVFENEPFFGQDRIDLLIWRMESRVWAAASLERKH